MSEKSKTKKQLLEENEELRFRLEEAEEILRGIRSGEVDALVVSGPMGEQAYTLKGAEKPYRVLVEAMNEGAITLSSDGTILFCNSRFAVMADVSLDKIIGRSINDFIAESHRKTFDSLIQKAHNDGVIGELALKQNGQDLPVLFSARPLPLDHMSAVSLIITDISERYKAEEELRKAYDLLEQRVRERTEELSAQNEELLTIEESLRAANANLEESYKEMETFSYSISHDLRAPLRIIGGMMSIVLNDYYEKLDDKGKNLLSLITENAKRMDKMIDAILQLSRIGKQELAIVDINVKKAASLISGDLKAAAAHRNINIEIRDLPVAQGDLTLIRQVLTNLLSNAVKFTKDRDPAIIEVDGWSEGKEKIYCVRDNGAGFNMEYTENLFKAFQRLHSQTEFEGTGIGLSLVQRIIQRHGGRVWAEGKENEGATFCFSLPSRNLINPNGV